MLKWAIIVTSDRVKKNPELDEVTPLLKEILGNRYSIIYNKIVGNNRTEILNAFFESIIYNSDVILVTGGTGPSPRDITVDVVKNFCDIELPGVGEEFRRRSFEKGVKTALISRAFACRYIDKLVIVSPGNKDAVKTMVDIILEIVEHTIEQIRGKKHHPH